MELPPADSPATVMFSGSPPKAAILSRYLIQNAIISGYMPLILHVQFRVGQPAEDIYPPVEGHKNNSPLGKALSVYKGEMAPAHHVCAAVNPEEHRELLLRAFRRSPDVEIQAVLVGLLKGLSAVEKVKVVRLSLGTSAPETIRLIYTFPILHRLRSFPTVFTHRRSGKGHAFEYAYSGIIAGYALYPAVFCVCKMYCHMHSTSFLRGHARHSKVRS